MKRRKKELFLSILGILALVAITTGVTFAFFNYTKEGTTENAITTGTITFLYTEVSGVGRGINIDDAYPISDDAGKKQVGEGNVFDFKVTSTTPSNADISYEVTARKNANSTLDESVVKLYLTEVLGSNEKEVLLANFNTLTQTSVVDSASYIEKTIYTGKVPADSTNYEQDFRLRMWIDSNTNFSPEQDENGNDTYPYNDKSFTVTINVYATAKVVTSENESTTPVAFIPKYFETGTPTSSSTTDYTTLTRNVFTGLGEDGSGGICINDGGLFCIKANDYENSVARLKEHFGEANCTDNGNSLGCSSDTFLCSADLSGGVQCSDSTTGAGGNAYSDGSFGYSFD